MGFDLDHLVFGTVVTRIAKEVVSPGVTKRAIKSLFGPPHHWKKAA